MTRTRTPAVDASMISVTGDFGLAKKGEASPVGTYGKELGRSTGPGGQVATPGTDRPSFSAEIASSGAPWPPSPGTTLTVKIVKCHDNEYNARQKYHPSVIKQRADSIAAEGQKVAAAACIHPDRPGEFILLDGGYRKRALLHLGRDEIRIEINEAKGPKDLYRLSRMYNKEREDGSAMDDALAWKKLLDDKVAADQNELVVLTGVDKVSITRTLSLLKLPEAIVEMIVEHPAGIERIPGYELYQLSKFAPAEDLANITEQVLRRELSTREMEAMRKRYETQPQARSQKRTREQSRIYRIRSEGEEGTLKDWDNGKILFEVKVQDARRRTELVEKMKELFRLEAPDPGSR